MKKILFLALIVFGAYQAYQKSGWFRGGGAAFDKDGKALVVLFTGPDCGEACGRITKNLRERGVVFQETSYIGDDGAPVSNKYGVRGYPTTVIGKQRIEGDDMHKISAALGEAYGKDALTRREKMAMDSHFDEQGRPKVVLYGTTWCGYCAKQRALFADKHVQFVDVNVEASDAGMFAYNALQGSGYPLTYVGYRRFDGFREDDILAAIDELSKTRQANVR